MVNINGDIEVGIVFEVFHFVFDSCVAIYVYLAKKNSVTNERIDRLTTGTETRIDEHATRLARLEETMKGVPTHNDLATLYTRVNEVSDQLQGARGELKSIHQTLHLIQDHLLNSRNKS